MRKISSQAKILSLAAFLAALSPVSAASADVADGKPSAFVAVRSLAVFKDTQKSIDDDEYASEAGLVADEKDAPAYIKASSDGESKNQTESVTSETENQRKNVQTAQTSGRPTVALALGGGGARGAAHVGVLKVLKREGIPIDYIAGTSMGAVVGGLYSAGVPISAIENSFLDAKIMKAFMTVPLSVRIAAAPVLILTRLVHSPYDGLYKGNKFRKFLERMMPDCTQSIESLKIPFSAVALNVVDGKAYPLTKGELGYAMQASSAVPGLRKPVEIGNNLYVDGGVVANLPVKQAKGMGADIVIAVNVDERVTDVPLRTFRKVGSVSQRMVLLQLANTDGPQGANADVLIHPNVDGIGLLSTKVADLRRAMKAGEEAAEAALPSIKSRLSRAQALNLSAAE